MSEAVELLAIDEWAKPSPHSECDVIIVNYNAGDLLLASVRSAFAAGASKVIVVDNDSHDDSLMLLARIDAATGSPQIVRNATNLGFAAACNQGARLSEASNLLFLNPDTELAADAIDRMLQALCSSPGIGMVGGFLCNPDGSEQAGGRRVFPTPRRAFMRAFGLSRLSALFPSVLSDFLLHKEPLPRVPVAVEAISGACMLVKREAIESVGLWDEDYFLHCEVLDWCMRFHQAGWRVLFVPDARVMHVFGGCSRHRPYFVEWHKHLGFLRFYRKFFRRKYPTVLWVSVIIGVWLRFGLVVLRHATNRLGQTWNPR
ncbi:glycosyltransferase family 2 protein [Pseudomonas sp. NR3]|uniref:glycosyltransferase family 2 protein n=1 Tax=Pseudomonas sp. NR3 TaxID=3155978 RepID=UPI003B66F01C